MATITEDYVSFEIAKLLKEKGFDEYCPLWYNLDKPIEGPFFYKEIGWYGHNSYDYNRKRIVSAPTLQMTMKWLRESHNLYIEPYVIKNYNNNKLEYTYSIQDLDFNGSDDGIECCKNWNSPEKACEAAIKYCLENLI